MESRKNEAELFHHQCCQKKIHQSRLTTWNGIFHELVNLTHTTAILHTLVKDFFCLKVCKVKNVCKTKIYNFIILYVYIHIYINHIKRVLKLLCMKYLRNDCTPRDFYNKTALLLLRRSSRCKGRTRTKTKVTNVLCC